ncbi:MAG: NAD(P)-dependent oxidoreductase [Schleiferilactobacillus perolens]|jgi:3-hydroxyisobutyrate dehydrogenase|uniref:NAD(P)-dependent oxidoreductase n=1 Tax=Schleiferilactobacillus perolens TaxID=100468 RepID=UPI0039EB05EA|nr:NAD(P)-dependent oxidoreductase [Schleiferilactobacillus harbinensis]MCI1911559.1 NAD(P)-dependent oxidoreductase [Schleiferilactobacillus harbinensis]
MTTKIGFIGTGVMGTGMVNNLLAAGQDVTVFNRTKVHAEALLDAGAKWADSPAALTRVSDVIISIVGFPKDVEEVYFSESGVFAGSHPGLTIIDMTTGSPETAKKIDAEARSREDVTSLDAPVSGGDIGAKEGTLTIMVGGSRDTFDKMLPIFQLMGHSIALFGPAGSGQNMKMANQIMIAGTMTGMTEMLVYARAAGLNLPQALKTIEGGAAANWSLSNYGPRILQKDYTPGFFAKHFLKDLHIALNEAAQMHLQLPGTAEAEHLYDVMVNEDGLGDLGTQGLIKLWWPNE